MQVNNVLFISDLKFIRTFILQPTAILILDYSKKMTTDIMNKVAMNAAVRKSNRLSDKKMNEKDAKFVSKFTRVFLFIV